MTVGRICSREIILASEDESARIAAQRMLEHNVGTVVVEADDDRPLGILTDRDLTLQVVAAGKIPDKTFVGDLVTRELDTVLESTAIEDALNYMRSQRHRRLVVTDEDEKIVGLLALDDVLELLAEEMTEVGALLESQKPRRRPRRT